MSSPEKRFLFTASRGINAGTEEPPATADAATQGDRAARPTRSAD